MQALCGVKILSWEAQLGCSLSPLGLFIVPVLGVTFLGLWTLQRGGLLVTSYYLIARSREYRGYYVPDAPPYPSPYCKW